MRRYWLSLLSIVSLLILLILLTACDRGLSNVASYDDLTLKIESNRSWMNVGDTIHVRFTVTNYGKQPYVVDAGEQPVLDLVVSERDKTLAAWSAQHSDKVEHRIEWKPGESRVLELDWTATQDEYGKDVGAGGFLRDDTHIVDEAGFGLQYAVGGSESH